ncbi:hypothetical protein C100_08055 [Sphingobium sp. C100]|uniref:hypothetical protein n=1 Tax=Sphingobium sp. C100 TaxID=1207055 RepID=UPI0003D5C89D|nr:hypothetical protein [Sphingobium sp. C100]ETI64279.1 hypothetical protein C100_08055 [Sphingobium sp. C100]
MSGPKVVRIVTREEILELCRGQLARVDSALAEWTRIGRRNDCIDDEAIAAAQSRRDALASLIASDRFIDLQKQAPIEEAFLRDDLQRRLAKVASAQADARSRERREHEAAKALLKALRKDAVPLDTELVAGLERGDSAATARGLLLLGGKGEPQSDASLAAKLREGVATPSFAEWASAQPAPAQEPAFDRIARRIAEIAQIADRTEESAWRTRLSEAVDAPPNRRHLILDALEVETGRALTEARRHAAALSEFHATLAEADIAGLDTAHWQAEIETLAAEQVQARQAEMASAIRARQTAKAVQARRAAVLEGLSGLGYEVSEGMSTAWAAEGRLVLRSAARPDYGVELSGADRFQMRPVAFDINGHGPEPSRDRDAETIWCGDVTGLEKRLAKLGDGLHIEKALAIGAVPLKRIEMSGPDGGAAAEAPVLRERTLR